MDFGVSPIIVISPWEFVFKLLHLATFLLFFSIPTIALTVWFFNRKEPKRRKRVFKVLAFAFIFTLLAFVLLASRNFFGEVKKELFPDVPPEIQQISNQYIMERVGREYLDAHFTYLKKESTKDDSGGIVKYYVRYDFLPSEQYVSIPIRIVVQDGRVMQGEYDNQVPNCTADESLCNFTLTNEKFSRLATENKISDVLRLQPPYLRALVCPEGKILLVDYRNGEILVDRDERNNDLLCFRPIP